MTGLEAFYFTTTYGYMATGGYASYQFSRQNDPFRSPDQQFFDEVRAQESSTNILESLWDFNKEVNPFYALLSVIIDVSIPQPEVATIEESLEQIEYTIVSVNELEKIKSRSDDEDQLYYRGLTNLDIEDIKEMGIIKSWALRKDWDLGVALNRIENGDISSFFDAHQQGDFDAKTPFISVTDDIETAAKFATSGLVAIIDTERAIPNPFNTSDTGFNESEYLIPIAILPTEIYDVQDK